MNSRYLWRPATLLSFLAAACMIPVAVAQLAPATSAPKPEDATKLEKFVVTGSLIKRVEGEGALPMLTITPMEMEQRGIASDWEPRVADPRGRSYTLRVDYKFY